MLHKYTFTKALLVTGTLLSMLCFSILGYGADQSLRSGDLIFLDLDCGDLCDAIEAITKDQFHVPGPNLSHVGILMEEKDEKGTSMWMVYEAWEKVQKTPLTEVIKRVDNDPLRYQFKRFKDLTYRQKKKLTQVLNTKLNLPYDGDFLINNGKFYCSELVAESFNEVIKTKPFEYKPMHFGWPGEKSWKTWEDYYRKLNKAVPSTDLGISPLGIYLQDQLLDTIIPSNDFIQKQPK